MAKRMGIYYAPGTSASSVNTGAVLRMTQAGEGVWPLFELVNTKNNRVLGDIQLEQESLREGDPSTVGFRNKLNALLTLLNVGLQTSVSQYQPVAV